MDLRYCLLMRIFGCLMVLCFYLLPLFPQDRPIDDLFRRVTEAIEMNNSNQAIVLFKKAIDQNRVQAEVYYWTNKKANVVLFSKLALELALESKKEGNYDKANTFCRELISYASDHVEYLLLSAEINFSLGYEKQAVAFYEKILTIDEGHVKANIFLGNYYYLLGEKYKKELQAEYKKNLTPTRMQYARYRDRLLTIFSENYLKSRLLLSRVMTQFPSSEIKKTLERIALVEAEVNR